MSLAMGARVKRLEERVAELEAKLKLMEGYTAPLEFKPKRRGRPTNAELERRRLEQESGHA